MRGLERGEWQGVQLASFALTLANQRADSRVRVAKRRSLFHQIVGKISSHHAARKRCAHSPWVEANLLECTGNSGEYKQDRVYSVEQNALVVLEILVVSTWQSLERGEQCRKIANGASARSARKLQRIGIAFLGHHARTRR